METRAWFAQCFGHIETFSEMETRAWFAQCFGHIQTFSEIETSAWYAQCFGHIQTFSEMETRALYMNLGSLFLGLKKYLFCLFSNSVSFNSNFPQPELGRIEKQRAVLDPAKADQRMGGSQSQHFFLGGGSKLIFSDSDCRIGFLGVFSCDQIPNTQ
ncbi:hypothetical protein PoB_003044200 [Plakobranchus ocellatus]|uniref:Uncharacterized protein n=1 Tax=Plakobranchus ocellatus TaxID=259542 RepID=A0AAV4A9R3_9GAST|nr:hypothetical protein PoB_003044200 [Plakobranchus ocellatus]